MIPFTRRPRTTRCPLAIVALFAGWTTIGCDDATIDAPEVRVEVLAAEPIDSAATIQAAVDQIAAGQTLVAIRGRIGVGDQPAFEPEKAAFLMSEMIDDPNAGEGHDASTCPFCKRRLEKAPKAYVVLVDESGEPLPTAADQTLSLRLGDVVQVRGEATYDAAINTVKVNASAIHPE